VRDAADWARDRYPTRLAYELALDNAILHGMDARSAEKRGVKRKTRRRRSRTIAALSSSITWNFVRRSRSGFARLSMSLRRASGSPNVISMAGHLSSVEPDRMPAVFDQSLFYLEFT
jgi:hypothetical protein